MGEELENAKTEEDVHAVLEKHPDLLEKLCLEENDALKNFIDAVIEVEDRLASALKRMNVEALAIELK